MATARYYPGFTDEPVRNRPDARNVAYLALGVAMLSAISVFFVLCERDRSFLVHTIQPEHRAYANRMPSPPPAPAPARTEAAAATSPDTAKSADSSETDVQPEKAPAPTENIPFVIPRSKHFQRLGPISIGVWRTDPKRGTYDAALLIEGHRFDKKRIHMDEALAITIGDGPPMQLLVNRVAKNDISGYLSKPAETASH
jgi:hypothetical protein